MKDEAIYRCIHTQCARALPRRVNYCPYCGTEQHAAGERARHAAEAKPAFEAAAASMAAASSALAPAAGKPAAAAVAAARRPGPAAAASGANAGWAPAAADVANSAAARAPSPAPPTAPGAAAPARSRKREPIRLRWWLLALVLLWAIWLVAKPTNRKIGAHIDKAMALATACKAREAQSELIALQSTRATPQQLQRLQQALNAAAADCTRARQRENAWRQTSNAVAASLNASSFDKARARLSAFTRRWGEDQETRELKARVDAGKRDHPLAAPQPR